MPARADEAELAKALRELRAGVFPLESAEAKELRQMLGKEVRARRDAANRRESAAWDAIATKEEWEKYRDQRLEALRRSLGCFPPVPKDLHIRTTGKFDGDGFTILNLVYESRPGLLVTANLYQPKTATASMPGIIICHSHHNPKTQGELQDMGMTWARQGCLVLVPDQLGHGERRQHPFTDATKYPGRFRPGRQDYYFRYNAGIQLDLIGESLIGWMVWDLMRGVDLLLQQHGIDPKRIILLGAVAGGGDPCAVTAALDRRIAAAVPFNFGGPQPESRFPLPKDARRTFNYAGGGSWESTRNLRLSCRDGFLPWVIVGGIAPRGLSYAHEFSWDREQDPVWKRLERIYSFYGASDHLAFVAGRGSVSGKPPESTHCNNIGPVHRQPIYPSFLKWFKMPAPDREYRQQISSKELLCIKPESGIEMKPLHVLAREIARERAAAFRQSLAAMSAGERRGLIRAQWSKLLGEVAPRKATPVRTERAPGKIDIGWILLRENSQTPEHPIEIPLLLLLPPGKGKHATVVGVAQHGKQAFLRQRAETIARLLTAGISVCLADVRGTGETRPAADSRGRQSASTAISSTELMLGGTLVGARLRDLRSVIDFLGRTTADRTRIALWGDSFAPVNPPDCRVAVPLDADKLPASSEPLGGLLALFGALHEKDIRAVYARGGLASFGSILDSPFCHLPHDAIIPGALTAGDLPDVAGALSPCPVLLEAMVTGLNQSLSAPPPAPGDNVTIRLTPSSGREVADWLIRQLK
jgi:dienelactone hydrolase